MADSKLLVPELSEADTMGDETARFEELLLQVRTDWTLRSLCTGTCFGAQRWEYNAQDALRRQQADGSCSCLG